MKLPITLALFTALTSTASVFAGDKGLNGGGGEVEFTAIKNELVSWMDARVREGKLGDKLELAQSGTGISDITLQASYLKAVERVGDRIKFQDDPIKLPGYSTAENGRICANSSNRGTIVCNTGNWITASPQIKYAIVFHEYLGVAEIETNQGEYSRYPISSKIIQYVKRSEKYELGSESSFLTQCPDLKIDGIWTDSPSYGHGPGNKFKIKQTGCMIELLDIGKKQIAYKIPIDGREGKLPQEFFETLNRSKNFNLISLSYVVKINPENVLRPVLSFQGTAKLWDEDVRFSADLECDLRVHEDLVFGFRNIQVEPRSDWMLPDIYSLIAKWLNYSSQTDELRPVSTDSSMTLP